ncbi:MAG: T9SS type A sorting domain-containing protein [Ignavibacteriae bacterium]|nr:T9SS C-terminal target domain-containing protein [Ignavibacteriota bacterium]NOG96821.1 T9SS type A sorting domain-containing protein [Ignavibacteriota bacterium]
MKLDINGLQNFLTTLPDEENSRTSFSKATLRLPMPNGQFEKFAIIGSPIMEQALAEKYPEIKTYRGQGINDRTASVRFDVTPQGFHAMILSAEGTIYIDPYSAGNIENYISYYKKDFSVNETEAHTTCGPIDADPVIVNEIKQIIERGAIESSGTQLRTYRLALACTGEYTSFHGGTVVSALAAMVTTMNRVNGVYERDVAIRMVLIANNDQIIYTNAGTDPYTNNSGFTMLSENQSNIDAVIGSSNYDIGHVFSTGGGGIASLGVPCRNGLKARGVTGLFQPVGDPFDIDYVAHEMGHQWGANHPFNGTAGNCSGGNRNASTAYEPGSGSTIMAYAGICGSQNLQSNSDDYFHGISFDEMVAYSTLSSGNGCAVITSTGNSVPIVNAGTGGFVIPINTPFSLTGSATDPDGDPMTYCWEQFDLGPAGSPTSPSGNAPIFRSFDPVTTPTRTFPKLSNILNNSSTIGEILPSYSRDLNFRITARDNRSGGGGVGFDEISFTVSNAAGPFLVTYPNTSVIIPGNNFIDVTWDVANTNAAPINCSQVNILLSTDGGQTFPIVLASATDNDGIENILLPDNQTTTARIKIEAVGNVFFDISNTNFQIDAPVPVELVSFRGFTINNGVYLEWKTATELNNYGFEIERSIDDQNFEKAAFIQGNGNSNVNHDYSYTDRPSGSGKFFYRLKQLDFNGSHEYSNTIEVDLGMPKEYSLSQNHPNPFNPSTVIEFTLPTEAKVSIKVYNTIGQELIEVVNDNFLAGVNRASFNAISFASGIYYYTINAEGADGSNFITSKKMILLK